jgi:uncharacterized protein YecE (DUF72 family)
LNPEGHLAHPGVAHELGDKRAVLVQLGPAHARDDATLGRFLAAMPAWIPVAMEFRHPTWHIEDVFAILNHHGAAYCVMSGAAPVHARLTAPFAYVRLCTGRGTICTAGPTAAPT